MRHCQSRRSTWARKNGPRSRDSGRLSEQFAGPIPELLPVGLLARVLAPRALRRRRLSFRQRTYRERKGGAVLPMKKRRHNPRRSATNKTSGTKKREKNITRRCKMGIWCSTLRVPRPCTKTLLVWPLVSNMLGIQAGTSLAGKAPRLVAAWSALWAPLTINVVTEAAKVAAIAVLAILASLLLHGKLAWQCACQWMPQRTT